MQVTLAGTAALWPRSHFERPTQRAGNSESGQLRNLWIQKDRFFDPGLVTDPMAFKDV